jgi:hypothetical protein
MNKIHAAKKSPRLKRVLACLRRWKNYGGVTTRQLIKWAGVCAVNSCVSELRAHGHKIKCNRIEGSWFYVLESR